MSEVAYQHSFQLVLLGDDHVGKTSISDQYFHGTFSPEYIPTIGINFDKKEFMVTEEGVEKHYKVKIFDLAGQKAYKPFRKKFLSDVNAVFLVFDLTNENSFSNLENWIEEIIEANVTTPPPVMLIGNKADKNSLSLDNSNKFTSFKLKTRAKYPQITIIEFFQTSAVSGLNIENAFLSTLKYLSRRGSV